MFKPYYFRYFIYLCLLSMMPFCNAKNFNYQIGTGIYDITGPAAEIDLMGYAEIKQLGAGIQSRLWSRAFIIKDLKNKKNIVFVSADLGMIFQSVKQGVVQALKRDFADLYNDKNIMLSATHTHSGPGGYAYETLFNFTVKGFYKDNYDTIVNGIVESIKRAHNNLEPGDILINEGTLSNSSFNRSKEAYKKNPLSERQKYKFDTDKSMTLLKLINADGKAVGTINWHAVHGVSMSHENTLISGDNKGYASYLFEKSKFSDYLQPKTFVAAFAQADEGDASPNIMGYHPDGKCDRVNCLDDRHMFDIGKAQYLKAKQLFDNANQSIGSGLDYRHQYIDMANTTIESKFTNGQVKSTCQAAIGYAFGAGTSDGPGMDNIFHQGQVKSNLLVNFLRNIIATPTKEMTQCHKPKPILLAVGLNKPAWVPHNMPIQLFKIGKLLIVGAPGEFTSMSGRRIKELLKKSYGSQIENVVIAGLSNSYAGYVTTNEEYQQQNYEGGFTVFGPWTLAAYSQSFYNLAKDMIAGKESDTGPLPENLNTNTGSLIPPVFFDDKLITKSFGSVHDDVKKNYHRNDTVHASFWAGHPRNNFETMKGFLEVQHKVGDKWQVVARDWDFNTVYHWQRIGVAYSYGHIYWKIPNDAIAGEYRIKHFGHYKYGWNKKIYPYNGTSSTFTIRSS